MAAKLRVGIIGCGAISPYYFNGCRPFPNIEIISCADMDQDRAAARAKEFNIAKSYSVAELLNDPAVDLVLNLTIPKAHAELNLRALAAGKHTYCEKPFALDTAEGRAVLALAKKKKLRVGCAPDTFLGAGGQTARRVIDAGEIGEPVAATAFMMGHGHESWHPSPEFYYKRGGGPMFDMGPYYVTALVNLFGPVRRVTGSTRKTFPTRTITSQPLQGTVVTVDVPTHYAGVVDFANGAVGTIIQSFDIWAHTLPCIEVHGTLGSLRVPDPNGFGGQVFIRKPGDKDWREVAHEHRTDVARGCGVADMARAIQTNRPHRVSGELAFHVLDIMSAFEDASTKNKHVTLKSTCSRPAALPTGLQVGELD